MKFIVDTHTHTVSSGHAYSTIQEMAKEAPNNGVEMFVITDHGPSMKGAPFLYHFGNMKTIPETLYGVRIIKGAEINILDANGTVDFPEEYLRRMDFIIAGFHEICIKPTSKKDHTEAIINVLKHPCIDAISHPGNPLFPVDIEEVVKAAKNYNKLIEINNNSFTMRSGSADNCASFAAMAVKHGVRIVCGSDAHISFNVGKFDNIYKLFEDINVPEELALCTSTDTFQAYLKERKSRYES